MNTLPRLIQEQTHRTPDAPAILAPGRSVLDYGRLSNQVEETVAALNAFGIGRNSRVAVVLPDGPEMALACMAVACAATCAPINPAGQHREFVATLASLHATALIVFSDGASPAIDAARDLGVPVVELMPRPDAAAGLFTLVGDRRPLTTHGGIAHESDVALALHTSGTTAQPTLVTLTHRNITTSARNICAALELTQRDRCLNVMPMFHIHGLSTVFASLAAGASVVCTPGLSAHAFFDWLQDFRPTWYTAAPTIHQVIRDLALRHADRAANSSLRFIRSASSAMPHRLMADLEGLFRVPLIQAYGMTEAGPQIASNRLPPRARKPGSAGQAAGPEIAIVDDAGNPQPAGDVGEIAIRGANVAVDGWFRTGDSGFMDADGDLFVTGRVNDVINRGGEKISPHEIDAMLMSHEAVAQAVTFAVPHPTLGDSVQAAVVLRGGAAVTAAALRTFAATRVARSKVPDRVVVLDAIPTGLTGKPFRRGLAEQLGFTTPRTGEAIDVESRGTATEARIASLLGEVLGLDPLGLHQHFFDAGGHSLTAAQAIARVSHEFHVDLPGASLFDNPTAATLAALVTRHPADARAGRIPRRDMDAPGPLSFAQQQLWFLDQLAPGNPAYNMQCAVGLVGSLDVAALERSLSEIRRRHTTLRTTISLVDGNPVQAIAPAHAMRLPVVDLASIPHDERQSELHRLAREEATTPFHLAHGPLFRALALRLGATDHVLLLGMHHIVSDGWSVEVLRHELASLYAAFSTGHTPTLAELPIQYSDYAAWQRRVLPEDSKLDTQLAYWSKQLRDLPPALNLPVDRPRRAAQHRDGATVDSTLSTRVVSALKNVSRRADATLFMTLLAAFEALLLRYTGQEDISVGTPVANRSHVDTEGLIGFFANTLVLRGDLTGDPPFRELVGRVRTTAMGAYANQDVPFEKVVEHLHPRRNVTGTPFVQVMFVLQNAVSVHRVNESQSRRASELRIVPLTFGKTAAKFDVTLYVTERDEGVQLSWLYDAGLFEAATITGMASSYATLLDGVVANPDCRLSALPLLNAEQDRAPLNVPAATDAPASERQTFDRLFDEQAARTPDAVAVRAGDEALTYRALDAEATRLARRLRHVGVGPDTRVGICLPRSIRMPIALLGVLKAGGAFVPLDPDSPATRLAFMLSDARVTTLITEESLRGRLSQYNAALVCMDSQTIDVLPKTASRQDATADSLAYIIYTSGSVGPPKGAMMTHGNVCHYVRAMQAALALTPQDRYLHTAPFAFSSSVRQFALPLSCGASVTVASSDQVRDPRAVFELVRQQHVTILDLVPSSWRACTHTLAALAPGARAALAESPLRMILSASETLTPDIPDAWRQLWPHPVRMINMYGQTETTGIVTLYPIPAPDTGGPQAIPIGRSIAHTRVLVLDAALRPVPVGVCGEVCVGGATVGRGYVNQPALTAERFVSDPFSDQPDARLYRTGDLARCRADGTIEFLGRFDHQVKIRGFRVEPQEIEAVLNAHEAVRESAVVSIDEEPDRTRLVAYVVQGGEVGASRRHFSFSAVLRTHLEDQLPAYMMPAAIIELPALPVTAHGKIDRKALAAREWAPVPSRAAADSAEGPASATEQLLASIWKDVLRVDAVGLDDNFFERGGDSILSVQVIERANQAGLRVRVEQLFRHQTIAGLAAATRAQGTIRREFDAPARRVTLDSMRAWAHEALERAGLSSHDAAIMTDVQIEASLRGQRTHNVGAIPRYARRLVSGATNARPHIRIERDTATSALVDGDNGPGQLVAMMAMNLAIQKAGQSGVAVVGARRSNHFGAAGHYAWMAAKANMIGLCTTNSALWLAPTGGVTPVFGTNPLGVGVAAGRHHPLVLDVSMSVTAKGKVALHLAEGKPLLPGWILDRRGRPTIDPADLSAGLGAPIGGHKGYGLALVMELLAGVLTGAGFGLDHRRELMKTGSQPVDFGHFFMAIDPRLFMPLADFTARVDGLIDQVKAAGRADDVAEILVPGEAEMVARERNVREDLPLDAATYETLRKYGDEAGLSTQLDVV